MSRLAVVKEEPMIDSLKELVSQSEYKFGTLGRSYYELIFKVRATKSYYELIFKASAHSFKRLLHGF